MFRLSDAASFLRLGALAEAERVCEEVLKREKRNSDAMLLLAHICGLRGRGTDSVALLKKALKIRPENPEIAYNLGVACNLIDDHAAAVAAYRQALALRPDHIESCLNLGMSLLTIGDHIGALPQLRHAHGLAPGRVDVALSLASALIEGEFFVEAAEILKAAEIFEDPEALVLRAKCLNGLGDAEAALSAGRAAVTLSPGMADAHISLGVSLLNLERPHEALTSFDRAIEADSQSFFAHHNRGDALQELGRLNEARAAYDRAHALRPTMADPLFDKALSLLRDGEFEAGWALYERRKDRRKDPLGVHRTRIPALGSIEQARGAHVFVDYEQGLGDTIQFCRYAKRLADIAARVTLRVQDPLQRLISTLDSRLSVVGGSEAAPQADFHVQTMSLPWLFRADAQNIPFADGYLAGESGLIGAWRDRIGDHGFKIAIAWQGNPLAKVDRGRSFEPSRFQRICAIPQTRLIAIQKGYDRAAIGSTPDMKIEWPENLDAGADAFLDTAAILTNVDLVITSDTAVAHLAGALGRPVWVALKHVPDWRWLMQQPDTPWYSSMRLFRQPSPGDWASVFDAIAAALEGELARG